MMRTTRDVRRYILNMHLCADITAQIETIVNESVQVTQNKSIYSIALQITVSNSNEDIYFLNKERYGRCIQSANESCSYFIDVSGGNTYQVHVETVFFELLRALNAFMLRVRPEFAKQWVCYEEQRTQEHIKWLSIRDIIYALNELSYGQFHYIRSKFYIRLLLWFRSVEFRPRFEEKLKYSLESQFQSKFEHHILPFVLKRFAKLATQWKQKFYAPTGRGGKRCIQRLITNQKSTKRMKFTSI